jgi:hypothetical protein
MQNEDLLTQFEDTSLPIACFHHEEHLRVAFLYLCRYPLLEVLARFPAALRRYAAAHGKNGLYHETISWAYIFVIRERIAGAATRQTWEQFKRCNSDLFDAKGSILMEYYREETIASHAAREGFVMPDRWLPERP